MMCIRIDKKGLQTVNFIIYKLCSVIYKFSLILCFITNSLFLNHILKTPEVDESILAFRVVTSDKPRTLLKSLALMMPSSQRRLVE